ncbi:c-type cytochrome [Orrella daihaiensis]|uniref:C-type cytochrome n=1 Tax=Orrella daihaiensis TaxID=2782176 RepID=A0ABY4AHB5_9BURK|nr:c-type cytochrome [Orrella daihaiensis]UOD49680.1 c-type cytochrome [Orrella daihaiensis]
MKLARTAVGLAVTSTGLLLGAAGTASANDLSAERIYHLSLAATCANCHGTGGVSVAGNDMPKINELTHSQIAEILRQYKSGEKTGTIMPQIAKGYTEEQIDIIAKVLGHD